MFALSQKWRWIGVLALFELIVGCGGENISEEATVCVPGATNLCDCVVNGTIKPSTQVCLSDGSGYGGCACEDVLSEDENPVADPPGAPKGGGGVLQSEDISTEDASTEEDSLVPQETSVVFNLEGEELDHVGKPCKSVLGFCYDNGADPGLCDLEEVSGVFVENECDGTADVHCCAFVSCEANNPNLGEVQTGFCVGTRQTRIGSIQNCEDSGKILLMDNNCPNAFLGISLTTGEPTKMVGCCVDPSG